MADKKQHEKVRLMTTRVIVAVSINVAVFGDVMPHSWVDMYQIWSR
jgi:hypothetical protein